MSKFAAGTASGEWLTVWAVSRFSSISAEIAEKKLKERGIEGKKVRVLEIPDFEYQAALRAIQKNEPYYVRFSEKPLTDEEISALAVDPAVITVDCFGMHEV